MSKLIIYPIIFIVFMGFFVPFVLGHFVSIESLPSNTLIDSITDVLDDGFTMSIFGLTDVNVNPFSLVPSVFMNHITDSLDYFSLFPEWLLISCFIVISVSICLGIVNIVRGI